MAKIPKQTKSKPNSSTLFMLFPVYFRICSEGGASFALLLVSWSQTHESYREDQGGVRVPPLPLHSQHTDRLPHLNKCHDAGFYTFPEKNRISTNSLVLVPKRLAEVAIRMTRNQFLGARKKKKKKLLWGKIYLKTFSIMLYEFHIWFFHIYHGGKTCTCSFFITSHISHLSCLTLSQDISLLALTWIFVRVEVGSDCEGRQFLLTSCV